MGPLTTPRGKVIKAKTQRCRKWQYWPLIGLKKHGPLKWSLLWSERDQCIEGTWFGWKCVEKCEKVNVEFGTCQYNQQDLNHQWSCQLMFIGPLESSRMKQIEDQILYEVTQIVTIAFQPGDRLIILLFL